MKISREEAYEELGVEVGADHSILKKAYYRLSKDWHPDKRASEEKELATEKFQRINAAYQKLLEDEDSDEEADFDMDDDILFEFFAYMQAKNVAHQAQRAGRRGFGGGGGMFGGGGGPCGGFPGGSIPISTPFGFIFVGGDPTTDMSGGGGGPFGGRSGGGKLHQARYNGPPPRSQQQQQQQQGALYESSEEESWETASDEYSSASDDDHDYYERQRERAFFRMKADERMREQDRVRAEYEEAMRRAREMRQRDAGWMAQLPRPVRSSFSETAMMLSVGRGAKGRGTDSSGELRERFFWEMQYRPLPQGQGPGEWVTLQVENELEVAIEGLTPGTKYAFRARPCKREVVGQQEVIEIGDWSVESTYATSGTAFTRQAPAVAQSAMPAPGTGKKARKKEAARAQASRQQLLVDEEAERERELQRQRAQQERDAAIQAAIAAAAADYEKHAAEAATKAQREVAKKEAARQQAQQATRQTAQAAKRKSKKGGSESKGSQPTSAYASNTTRNLSTAPSSSVGAPLAATASCSAGPLLPVQPSMGPVRGREGTPVTLDDANLLDRPEEFIPLYTDEYSSQQQRQRAQQQQQQQQRRLGGGATAGGGRQGWDALVADAGVPGGGGDARARLENEAANEGMTVEQYLAHQEDLALQEAIKLSLALEESRQAEVLLFAEVPEGDIPSEFATLSGIPGAVVPGLASAGPAPASSPPLEHFAYQKSPLEVMGSTGRGSSGGYAAGPVPAPSARPRLRYYPMQQAPLQPSAQQLAGAAQAGFAQQSACYGQQGHSLQVNFGQWELGHQREPFSRQQYPGYSEQYQGQWQQQYQPAATAQDFLPPQPYQQYQGRHSTPEQYSYSGGHMHSYVAATPPEPQLEHERWGSAQDGGWSAAAQEAMGPGSPPQAQAQVQASRPQRALRMERERPPPRQQCPALRQQKPARPQGVAAQAGPVGTPTRRHYMAIPQPPAPESLPLPEHYNLSSGSFSTAEGVGGPSPGQEGLEQAGGAHTHRPPCRRTGYQEYMPPTMRAQVPAEEGGGLGSSRPGEQPRGPQAFLSEAELLQAAYG